MEDADMSSEIERIIAEFKFKLAEYQQEELSIRQQSEGKIRPLSGLKLNAMNQKYINGEIIRYERKLEKRIRDNQKWEDTYKKAKEDVEECEKKIFELKEAILAQENVLALQPNFLAQNKRRSLVESLRQQRERQPYLQEKLRIAEFLKPKDAKWKATLTDDELAGEIPMTPEEKRMNSTKIIKRIHKPKPITEKELKTSVNLNKLNSNPLSLLQGIGISEGTGISTAEMDTNDFKVATTNKEGEFE
jgi:hypothetical protein